MQRGYFLAKGKAHAAAARFARAGFIHHIKRLGDAPKLMGGNAAALVPHKQHHMAALRLKAHLHGRAGL